MTPKVGLLMAARIAHFLINDLTSPLSLIFLTFLQVSVPFLQVQTYPLFALEMPLPQSLSLRHALLVNICVNSPVKKKEPSLSCGSLTRTNAP